MLRSVVLILALGLSGCSSCGPLEEGRYQCDPDLLPENQRADAPQCPGDSRCGLEKFCHRLGDVSVAWKCNDMTDCENGYACGLAATRLSRECHNPMEPDAGFACEVETDCVRGWHCGAERLCYDRSVKSAYPCRRHVGNADCSPGWRCGLENVCHDTAVADAYQCERDEDCELDWRCGLDSRCLNPSVDALRSVTTTLGEAEKINPLLLDHAPQLLAVSPVQSPGFNLPRQFLAYYDEGNITVLDLSVGSTPPIGTNPHRIQVAYDAGQITSLATLGATSLDVFGSFDDGSWTYLTRPDGGFDELHFRSVVNNFGFDGTPYRQVYETEQFFPVEIAPNWLRVGTTEDGYVPTLTAWDRSPVPLSTSATRDFFYGWGARSRAAFYPFGQGNNADISTFGTDATATDTATVDIATVSAHRRNEFNVFDMTDCSVIADSRGLFVQQHEFRRGGSNFKRYFPTPLIAPPFANKECEAHNGVPQSHRITGLSSMGRDWIGVSAHPMDGGVAVLDTDEVALIDVSSWWEVIDADSISYPFRGCIQGIGISSAQCKTVIYSPNVLQPVRGTTVLGPCRVCAGAKLVTLSVLPSASGRAKLEVRCRTTAPDGGVGTDYLTEVVQGPALGTSCVRTPLQISSRLGFDSVEFSRSNSGQLGFAGPRGHLWLGRSSSTAAPVFFDEAPTGILGDGQGAPVFIGPDRIGWYAGAPFGVLAFPLYPQDGDRPVAAVVGDQQLAITAARSVISYKGVAAGDTPIVLASADGTPTRFEPPYLAAQTKGVDGGSTIIVTAGDVVLSANLALTRPLLARRLVPAEGKAIISLLTLPSTSMTTAFALTTNALFKITAQTDQLWSAVEAPLPPGTAIKLWADGTRGRIGYSDGRVFSLETRVQIGESLGKRVDDFSQSCGQAYALAEGTIYRLATDPNGGAIGHWQPVALDGGIPQSELGEGRMLPFLEADAGTTLHLFSRRGEAVRMPVRCP